MDLYSLKVDVASAAFRVFQHPIAGGLQNLASHFTEELFILHKQNGSMISLWISAPGEGYRIGDCFRG
jgi:hypothetical protein